MADDSVHPEPDVPFQAQPLEHLGPFEPKPIDWRSIGLVTKSITARAGGSYCVDLKSKELQRLLEVDNEALQVRPTAAAARQDPRRPCCHSARRRRRTRRLGLGRAGACDAVASQTVTGKVGRRRAWIPGRVRRLRWVVARRALTCRTNRLNDQPAPEPSRAARAARYHKPPRPSSHAGLRPAVAE